MLKRAYYAYGAALAGVQRHRPIGTNIYDAEWDICIVLDSTRADAMADTAPSTWNVESRRSVGSVTTEWLTNTFHRRRRPQIEQTALVTATPHSQTVFRDREWLTNHAEVSIPYPENPAARHEDFGAVYELWRTHAGESNVVPPDVMCDATIQAYRRHGGPVVAHWMQPHEPFISPDARCDGVPDDYDHVWSALSDGGLSLTDVRQSYRANLGYALEYVKQVRESVDATLLITSDHGNAFGEWGVWGHPFGCPLSSVRRVPWVTLGAMALTDYDPAPVLDEGEADVGIEEQLYALGYR